MSVTDTIVTILGDSRTLDTYYYNSNYKELYGYDKTFPYLLQRSIEKKSYERIKIIHIPDQFRANSIENNILRLALTDPDIVILCNGIWETLLNKKMYLQYAIEKINAHKILEGNTLELNFNSQELVKLYLSNSLSNSPQKFFSRQNQIISYFRRRQRQCFVMNIPVPDIDHLNRLHFAGNYRCIPEWGICIEMLNEGIRTLAENYQGIHIDTHELIKKEGGFNKNLIDQWHFSKSFHIALSRYFEQLLLENSTYVPVDHISHDFMLHKGISETSIVLYGTGSVAADWLKAHPGIKVEFVVSEQSGRSYFHSIPVIEEREINNTTSSIVLLAVPENQREEIEISLIKRLQSDKILLYPEEVQEAYYTSLYEQE